MRYLVPVGIVAVALVGGRVMADPSDVGGDKKKDMPKAPVRAEMHEKIVKEFDKDGDGKLNDEERRAAREGMRDRWDEFKKNHPEAGKKQGDKAAKKDKKPGKPGESRRGQRDRRGPEGRGPRDGFGPEGRGPGGPMGARRLPPPEEMFAKFDEDKNDSLSKDEFMKLTEFVRDHRPMGPPPGGPEGRGFRGRGPDARGPEGRPGRPPRDGEGQPTRDGERRRGDREGRRGPDGDGPPHEEHGDDDKHKDEEKAKESST